MTTLLTSAPEAAPAVRATESTGLDALALLIRAPLYQTGPLVLVDCATGSEHVLDSGPCYGACFSPDGTRVAYSKDGAIYVRPVGEAGEPEEITMVVGNNFLYWTDTDHLYFHQHPERTLYRVHLERRVREVVFTSTHSHLNAMAISRSGRRGAWSNPTYVHGQKPTWDVKVWDLVGKPMEREIGPGAKGTISPNGELVTRGIDGARTAIHRFTDGTELSRFGPPSGTFNGVRFTHSSDEHVVYTQEGTHRAYIHHLPSGTAYPVAEGAITDAFIRP